MRFARTKQASKTRSRGPHARLAFLAPVAAAAFAFPSAADAAFFDLRTTAPYPEGDIESLDDANSFSITVDGITATLTATRDAGDELNQTSTGFGVNNADNGDETNTLDGDNGNVDEITVSFNVAVFFEQFVVAEATSNTVAAYDVAGDTGTTNLASGGAAVTEVFDPAVLVETTDDVLINWQSGATGFSFDSFTVTPVPEPASLAIALGGAALLIGRRPWRA